MVQFPNAEPDIVVLAMTPGSGARAAGLSLGSAAAFLLPWVTAIAGAVVVRGFEAERAGFSAGQALAALGGLLLGGVGAWLVMPMIRKWFGADADDGPGSGG